MRDAGSYSTIRKVGQTQLIPYLAPSSMKAGGLRRATRGLWHAASVWRRETSDGAHATCINSSLLKNGQMELDPCFSLAWNVGRRVLLCVGLLWLVTFPTIASAELVNGDFETGDFTGWTTYNDPNGKAFGDPGGDGTPLVSMFDTTGGGQSLAAHFNAARTGGPTNVNQGGGIFQSLMLNSGDLTITADVAIFSPGNNAQGGYIELLFDDQVVDDWDVGFMGADTTLRRIFNAEITGISAGMHEIRFSVQRRFGETSGPDSTPNQYVDNFQLSGRAVAVPEPASAAGLLGLTSLVALRRRCRRGAC
jgi:hypothetical protein